MSTNQLHGLTVENLIKTSGYFPGAEGLAGQNNAVHDIPAELDPFGLGLPTSIKTLKMGPSPLSSPLDAVDHLSGVVCLADAVRLHEAILEGCGVRLFVGRYTQEAGIKVLREILSMDLTPARRREILGDVDIALVREAKAAINARDIPPFDSDPAGFERGRRRADDWFVRKLREDAGIVQFNPKVSRRGERRLQCSAPIGDLWELLKDDAGSVRMRTSVGQLGLPLSIRSTPRSNARGEEAAPDRGLALGIAAE